MHVCFFNRSYWPDVTATGQLLTELAEDLVERHGWRVTVVAGYPATGGPRPPAAAHRRGVHIIRAAGVTFEPRRFAGRAANYLTYFASATMRGLGLDRPDVVVGLTDPPIIGLAARAAALRAGAAYVYLCEDVFPEVAVVVEDFHSDTVNRALSLINRYLLRHADAIVALGDTMKRRLVEGKGADPARISVIHNWADCELITPRPRDNAFARAHGLVDPFVVLHAGNIGLSQNLPAAIEAAALLRDRRDIAFAFVGAGTGRAALEAQAAREQLANVRFFPFQPRALMADSYATADVSLISLRAGLSGVIVPSKLYTVLASGRAVVAAVESDCEVASIVTAAGCGVVVPPGDAPALARAIAALADDRAGVAALGTRARVAALNYDRRGQVAAYDTLLRQVARC